MSLWNVLSNICSDEVQMWPVLLTTCMESASHSGALQLLHQLPFQAFSIRDLAFKLLALASMWSLTLCSGVSADTSISGQERQQPRIVSKTF